MTESEGEGDEEEDPTPLINDPSNPWLHQTGRNSSNTKGVETVPYIDPHSYMKSGGSTGGKLAQASDNLLAVQEAFAGMQWNLV